MAVTVENTLLGQCTARAMLATGVEDPRKANAWLAARVTPKASRVAKFVVLWADALRDNDGEPIGIEAYVDRGYSSRAKSYRDQADFRELWPEYETPHELATVLLEALERGEVSKLSPNVAVAL